jgi:radical SAM superfamily enzyme YgiQ (UPF0313 family)
MSKLKPKIVLVADRTLSGRYKILFEAIFATMQTTHVPEFMMRSFVSPAVKVDSQGRAESVPLGLCRVESALLSNTELTRDDILCTTPEGLPGVLSNETQIVAFSSSDPLGIGMSNTTTKNFWKGELYTSYWSAQTLEYLARAKEKYDFKVVAGGAGAWQFRQYPEKALPYVIDLVFEGYFEKSGPNIFTNILEKKDHPCFYLEEDTCGQFIESIKSPSVLGIVEISRGCGKGCKFCTMAHHKMEHLPVELIKNDIEINVHSGQRSAVLASEDFFRYGSGPSRPDVNTLFEMLEMLRSIEGLDFVQLDHANVSTIAQISVEDLKEIRKMLTFRNDPKYLWVNMGLESANGQLVKRTCPAKISPFDPDNWENIILETADKMNRSNFFPVYSIILGLPGETLEDVERTSKLIDRLDKSSAVIFPIFYEPVDSSQIVEGAGFDMDRMMVEHLNLYRKCYEINFKRMPGLFRDNQSAGGESFLKKLFVQMLGKVEIITWRKSFADIHKKILRRMSQKAEDKSVA